MRVASTLKYLLFNLMKSSDNHGKGKKKKKKKLSQTVDLKVRMDCEGCELKVKKALSSLKGVEKVEINRKQQKVSVTGCIEANKVLDKAKSTGNKAEIWPYVPYSLVTRPYIYGSYDRKAPPGYARKEEEINSTITTVTKYEDSYINMFSDDNPNACSIM